MKSFKIFLALIAVFSSVSLMGQTSINGSFSFQSVTKKYSIMVPSSYNSTTPVKMMVGMHPFNTNRWDAESWRDTLTAFANANDLLLVCPDGGTNGNVLDQIDTSFTNALIDSVFNWYNVDQSSVYMIGFSVGGRANYVYGLQHPEIFSGYIPIGAATNSNDLTTKRKLNAACKPIAIIHGSNDAIGTRFTPIKNILKNETDFLWDTLLSGVGHTIDFANRNAILDLAYNYIDSINHLAVSVSLGGDRIVCGGDSLEIGDSITTVGGNCNYSYSWSPVSGLDNPLIKNPKVSVSTISQYVLTVMDSDGKTGTDTITIFPKAKPIIATGSNDTLCPNVRKTFIASGAATYKWNANTALSCTSCANPSIRTTVKRVFYVTGTDTNGCTATDSLVVDVFAAPKVRTNADTTICAGDTGQFITTGAANYRWLTATDISDSTVGNPKFFPTQSGIFVVYGTSVDGCVGTDFVSVAVRKLPALSVNKDTTICYNSQISLMASGATKYSWEGNDDFSCDSCQNTFYIGKQSEKITVTGSDNFGCKASVDLNLTVRAKQNINTSNDTTVCEGDTVHLKTTSGVSHQWVQGTVACPTCASTTAQPSTGGSQTFIVRVTDQFNCSDTAHINVLVYFKPNLSVSSDTTICKGDTITLSATSNGIIKWKSDTSLNNPLSNNPTVFPSSTQTFEVTSENSGSCKNAKTMTVSVQDPIADFTISGAGNKWSFDPSPSTDYDTYSFDYKNAKGTQGTDEFEYDENGSFDVCLTVETTLGCNSVLCKKVEITGVGVATQGNTKNGITVFPNPANSIITISSEAPLNESSVYSLSGELILENGNARSVDISALEAGNYFLVISTGESVIQVPLIKVTQ